jgi:cell wall-associated NlpC family hydrolase
VKIKIKIFSLFLSIILISIFSGCSSSSNSIRYSENNRNSEAKSSAKEGRYSSDNAVKDDSDDLPADEKSVDISPLTNNESIKNSYVQEKLLMDVIKYLNTPYEYGGNSKSGIDCSAFTQKVYSDCLSYQLPRTVSEQYNVGINVNGINNLQFGDLVFFDTSKYRRPGHVGIYLGDDLFAHASSSKGVIVSSLNMEYYLSRFMGGRRIKNISDLDARNSAER